MNKDIEKILVDLVKTSLNLPDNYGVDANGNQIPSVLIQYQNLKLYNTEHLQVTIGTVSSQVFSNRRENFEKVVNGEVKYFERNLVNEQRVMQIDAYSRNNEARERFWEIEACLNNTKSIELQDKYQFRISKISNSFNNSGLDGGSDIYRYTIRFNCLTWQEKVQEVNYYTAFRVTAQDGYPNSTEFADISYNGT